MRGLDRDNQVDLFLLTICGTGMDLDEFAVAQLQRALTATLSGPEIGGVNE
jgi:hypothetical protein